MKRKKNISHNNNEFTFFKKVKEDVSINQVDDIKHFSNFDTFQYVRVKKKLLVNNLGNQNDNQIDIEINPSDKLLIHWDETNSKTIKVSTPSNNDIYIDINEVELLHPHSNIINYKAKHIEQEQHKKRSRRR